MTLDEAKTIRSIIDYYPNYKILEDIHLENDEFLMKVRITIDDHSTFVPKESDWYVVFYSAKDIDFYPAKEKSIIVTFPHQAYNIDLPKYSYRSGKPCLDVPEHVLNLPDSYYPYNNSLFSWYLERMLDWLKGAATNSLFKAGDPFEVPITEFAKHELVYKEAGIADWSNYNYRAGYGTLRSWSNGSVDYYVLDKLYDKNEIDIRKVNWGDISKQFETAHKKSIWVICNNFPIEEPWQYPKTWEKLLNICKSQNVDLFNIICSLLWKDCKYKRSDFYLLLACPIPKKHGEESESYYWIMCDIPTLSFPRNGFRKNKDGFKTYLKNAIRGPISWHKTNNWDDIVIRTRGMVQKEFRELSYAIIGTGALGGFVCELLSRQGIGNFKIIDGDKLQIGNLSRHVLTLESIGKNKAKAMAEKLAQNSPSVKVKFKENYLNKDNISFLDDCDVIIDCTGDNDVIDILSICEFETPKHIYIGAFTYGAKGFSFYKQYTRAINSNLFFEKTSDFYKKYVKDIKEDLTMEGIGCYHPVFPALDSDVNLWSSIFVKEIVKDLANPVTGIMKAFEQSDNGAIEISIDETF